jgi:two-component system, sensor histidine kinase and response regulator
VYADAQMMRMILGNVISNALKFTRPGGMVRLSASEQDQHARITISDTGCGIAADAMPRLFQLDDHYSQFGTAGETGTGLGLIVCKALVEKHRGMLDIESEVDAGTIVTLRLPVGKPDV